MARRKALTRSEHATSVVAARATALELADALDHAAAGIRAAAESPGEFSPALAKAIMRAFTVIDDASDRRRSELAVHLTGVISYAVIARIVRKNVTWIARRVKDTA